MFRFVRLVSHLGPIPRLALFFCGLAVFAAAASDTLNAQTSGVQLAVSPSGGIPGFRAQMAFPPLAPSGGPSAGQCRPPTTLCSATIKALEQGAFLDFRASQEGERAAAIRLLAPFDVVRIDALDRTRCPAKLCAGHVALEGVLADLMREGYLTHNVVLYPASAMLTLRTERIGRDTKVLKGACRFNLDTKCVDSNTWVQEDQRIAGP